MIPWLLALAARAELAAADHRGRPEGDGIGWSSTFACEPGDRIPLAVPLAADEVARVAGASPEWEDGRLVALRAGGRTVVLGTRQAGQAPLRPPLALAPGALQQVSLEDLRYRPAASLGLVPRVGWHGPDGVTGEERRRALARVADGWRHRHGATIVRIDRPLDGLAGEVGPANRVPVHVLGGALAAAAVALLGLLGLHRALERTARRERIDAFFAEAERATTDGPPAAT